MRRLLIGIIGVWSVGCGGAGGASQATGSGDATLEGTSTPRSAIVSLRSAEVSPSFKYIPDAEPQKKDSTQFGYTIFLKERARQSRRCEATLRVIANGKTRYRSATAAWNDELGAKISFVFAYSDFNLQRFTQLKQMKAALKLDCRVLGELK